MSSQQKIYFDESGSTGEDLLNTAQPVFVLSSTQLQDAESSVLLEPLLSNNTPEVHFTQIKKQKHKRAALIEFANNPDVVNSSLSFFIYKPFMIVTKIVDLLVEEKAYLSGYHLYEEGGTLALSNLYFMYFHNLIPYDQFNELQRSFVSMFRWPSEFTISTFYDNVIDVKNRLPEFARNDIDMILITSDIASSIVRKFSDGSALEPAVTSFVALMSLWCERNSEPYIAVHDETKKVQRYHDYLNALIDDSAPSMSWRYGDSTSTFPIKVSNIVFARSQDHKSLQFSDVIAGICFIIYEGYIPRRKMIYGRNYQLRC